MEEECDTELQVEEEGKLAGNGGGWEMGLWEALEGVVEQEDLKEGEEEDS